MGQILSHSEVEAILSSLDFTSGPTSAVTGVEPAKMPVDVTPYDFEHPEPLRNSQIERLQIASASVCSLLQNGFSGVLNSTAEVRFLGVEQSTFCDYLATSERPGCLAVIEAAASPKMCLVDIHRSLAFTFINCLMGGAPSSTHDRVTLARPFTEFETRLLQKTIRAVIPNDLPGGSADDDFRVTKLVSDSALLAEATSNEAVALVSYEITCGPSQGMMQLCIPWKQVAHVSVIDSSGPEQFRNKLRTTSGKVPLLATARIASFQLSTRELANLSLGDVLLTDTLASGEISLEVDGQPIFRGAPGQSHNRKVIRLTSPVATPRSVSGTDVACSEDRADVIRP